MIHHAIHSSAFWGVLTVLLTSFDFAIVAEVESLLKVVLLGLSTISVFYSILKKRKENNKP
jgi:hypothetical protein